MVFAIVSKLAFSHGVPETNCFGSAPWKYCNVAVRDHGRVEVREVHPEFLHVAREYLRIVSGIEEDALSLIFHERRESPIHLQSARAWAEGVIEDGDPLRLLGTGRRPRHGAEEKE